MPTTEIEHDPTVIERPNGALEAACPCGWDWGYATAVEQLAEDACNDHLDEVDTVDIG